MSDKKKLPSRPDLDLLRRRAKALLAGLREGDRGSVTTLQEHLPAASGLDAERVRAAGYRLADAQFAMARQMGFASWPRLARYVEQLRALEGTWSFERLEVDGRPSEVPEQARLLIDGDRFRMPSPEGGYDGVFTIDVEAEPHLIDIDFVEGPEAGTVNRGIFRLEGDRFELCLDMTGRARPGRFATAPGTGHALETLRRTSRERPAAVTGGVAASNEVPEGFDVTRSPVLDGIQGEWSAMSMVRDGEALPAQMLATCRRLARGNEVEVWLGPHRIINALMRVGEGSELRTIDYFHLTGSSRHQVQHGVLRHELGTLTVCMAPVGDPHPEDFTCPQGSGRTLSQWRSRT